MKRFAQLLLLYLLMVDAVELAMLMVMGRLDTRQCVALLIVAVAIIISILIIQNIPSRSNHNQHGKPKN